MKRFATTLSLLLAAAWALPAQGATINFTGTEVDFTSQGITPIQDDGVDTQTFCGNPLDIGRVYITNDAAFLYIGMQYKQECFCDMNLFWAFDVRNGGTTNDPFCRAIDWSLAPSAPDFIVYDVVPTNCNGFNYEALFESNNGGGWNTLLSGPNSLGIVDGGGVDFVELKIPLATLGLGCPPGLGAGVYFEIGTTQEGCTKPAFDLVANDSQQRSDPFGTCFDIGPCPPSMPRNYLGYGLDCPVPAVGKSWGSVKGLYR
jgi:hypothetical protein